MNAACHVCADRRPGALPAWFRGSHCFKCCSSWTGATAAHATCCHRTFSSNKAADMHRVRGVCTDPATVPALKLVTRADGHGYWTPTSGARSPGINPETLVVAR